MNPEPRFQSEYGSRQTDAAHRVLIDLAQVLAPFQDCLVLIGGWVPYLLLPNSVGKGRSVIGRISQL